MSGTDYLNLYEILVRLVSAYVCATTAAAKGHNPWRWGILGLMFGIFAVVAIPALSDKDIEQRRIERLRRYCTGTRLVGRGENPGLLVWQKLAEEAARTGSGTGQPP